MYSNDHNQKAITSMVCFPFIGVNKPVSLLNFSIHFRKKTNLFCWLKSLAVKQLFTNCFFLEDELEDDAFVNQDRIFEKNFNYNVESAAIKSNKQREQVIFNSRGSLNDFENNFDAIHENNIDAKVEDEKKSKESDRNHQREILNNYEEKINYQCPDGNFTINKLTRSLTMVFRRDVRCKHCCSNFYIRIFQLKFFLKVFFGK